jgi:hypothetical protein
MSLTKRPVNTALENMLMNNEPFQYAHLIKFERPSRPDSLSGLVSTSRQRYTYLTDASINVTFDDGSKNLQGTANGTQTYLANKVLKVGSVQEQTKASTSQTTLSLDGNALGASIVTGVNITLVSLETLTTPTTWDIALTAPVTIEDMLLEGFREGDKVSVNGTLVNILSFRSNNTIRVTKIDDDFPTLGSGSGVTIRLASEEIISILLNKNAAEYASFINREVYIYRAYFQDGVMVGGDGSANQNGPELLFRGIISNVGFEDSESNITVNWGLTSHWGDFAQVRGRVTSDSAHRALNENGVPQPTSALKPIYAYDKGFAHSETSVNMLAKYTVQVPDQEIKSKKGVLGIGASVKVKKFMRTEDRFTDLDFQLQAKSIPVIYGVRVTEGIGIFADTLKNDSANVYAISALCEGEIGGIYDIYIDGNSLICNDKADADTRSAQTADNTVELICRGRADRGDALGGQIGTTNDFIPYYSAANDYTSISDMGIANFIADSYLTAWDPEAISAIINPTTYGVVDGESIRLTSPQEVIIDVFTGKSGQKASSQLSSIALAKNFKIQNDYWTGSDTSEYWGPNHRLLDTAYVVGNFVIKEGESTIPPIQFVVRGKLIDCYNYDYSYIHDSKAVGDSPSTDFVLGQYVNLYTGSDVVLNSNVQIIDKWTFINPDGSENTRFRFSTNPNLTYIDGVPSTTSFYMKSIDGTKKWSMLTYNYNRLSSSNVPGPISSPISSVNTGGGNLIFNYASNTYLPIDSDPVDFTAKMQVVKSDYTNLDIGDFFTYGIMVGTNITSTSFTSGYGSAGYGSEASQILTRFPGALLVSKNTIRLPASASSTADFYKGDIVEVTRVDSLTGKSLVQTGEIVGYDGSAKIATIDTIWDFIPVATDKVRIYPKYVDSRVSINPAMQALDYITSQTYGRGLAIDKDINIPSWLDTARKCDTRSKISLIATSAPTGLTQGAVYKYTNSSGNIIWQGTYTGRTTLQNNGKHYIEFDNVLGKFSNKWNSWKTWKQNEIIYNTSGQCFRVNTPNIYGTEPSSTAVPAGLTYISNNNTDLVLTRDITGPAGPTTIPITVTESNPVQDYRAGKKISGYSLYDSDGVDYWRLSGWDGHDQRYVTRNQCNIIIDTSVPLFENINSILEHFNGILRYTSGQYYLDLEEEAETIPISDVRTITADDIIGKIQLSDEGTRSAFNSLTAAFADPASKFEAKNISFFNSDYLKADRNVPKKGNLSIPGITNYYNTRLLADSFLNKSRYGLTINMTVRPSGLLLLAGTVIQVIYPRYDWVSPGKKFRIDTVNYQPDGLVDIVAKEYDDSFYALTNVKGVAGTGATTDTAKTLVAPDSGPTNLVCSQDRYNQVLLTWENGPNVGFSTTSTEIHRSDTNNFANATIIAIVPVYPGSTSANINEYVDAIPPTSDTQITKYYWVRHKVVKQ